MSSEVLVNKILANIPKNTIGRYDILPIIKDKYLFADIINYLASPFHGKVDYVASPEAIGWIIGVAMARELNVRFIQIRKSGKLPYKAEFVIAAKYADYSDTEKGLEVSRDFVNAGSKILLTDEWVETGRTFHCCIDLLNTLGAINVGLATIGIDYQEGTKEWIDSGFVHFIGCNI